ncbi:hypothetical protein ECPA28_1578, partial [Escherichia coli PA28]
MWPVPLLHGFSS